MRRTIPVLGAVLSLAVLAGCGSSPQHVDGPAVPVGAASPASAVPTSAAPPSSPPSGRASPRITATIQPAALVLGPTGLKNLKIGMTVNQAKATGMIEGYRSGESCGSSHLQGQPDAVVTHSPAKGVVAILAYGQIHTPEGIHLGSTLAQVKRAYPSLEFSQVDDDPGNGRAWAKASASVNYRFSFGNEMLIELGLEHKDQDCYE